MICHRASAKREMVFRCGKEKQEGKKGKRKHLRCNFVTPCAPEIRSWRGGTQRKKKRKEEKKERGGRGNCLLRGICDTSPPGGHDANLAPKFVEARRGAEREKRKKREGKKGRWDRDFAVCLLARASQYAVTTGGKKKKKLRRKRKSGYSTSTASKVDYPVI